MVPELKSIVRPLVRGANRVEPRGWVAHGVIWTDVQVPTVDTKASEPQNPLVGSNQPPDLGTCGGVIPLNVPSTPGLACDMGVTPSVCEAQEFFHGSVHFSNHVF